MTMADDTNRPRSTLAGVPVDLIVGRVERVATEAQGPLLVTIALDSLRDARRVDAELRGRLVALVPASSPPESP
jgi:hypothetical protein